MSLARRYPEIGSPTNMVFNVAVVVMAGWYEHQLHTVITAVGVHLLRFARRSQCIVGPVSEQYRPTHRTDRVARCDIVEAVATTTI